MQCDERNGQALAAAEALTVSELDLQRIKQKGCGGPSQRDRLIMRLPDLKALPYPSATNVPSEVCPDANAKHAGRKSLNAEAFAPPFAQAKRGEARAPSSFAAQVVAPRATLGPEFSGSGDIAQLNAVTFGSAPALYKEIAAQIRGAIEEPEETPAWPDASPPLGRLEVPRVYGAARRRAPFSNRCVTALKGILYDLLHYDEARGHSTSHFAAARDIFCRHGRAPYVLFVLVLLLLCALLLYMARGAAAPAAPVLYAYVPLTST
jgi:hypothetical protein